MIDYCSWFPEYVWGTYIGDCCKQHDGTLSTSRFYKCLRVKINIFGAVVITIGGAIGAWIKYPKEMMGRI